MMILTKRGIALGATFAAICAFFISCSGSIELTMLQSGSSTLEVKMNILEACASKIGDVRQKSGTLEGPKELFDLDAIRADVSERKGVSVVSLSSPTPSSVNAKFGIKSIMDALGEKIIEAGIVSYDKKAGSATMSFRINRENAHSVLSLFPGIDMAVVEALSAPAISGEDYTTEEYRMILSTLFGPKGLAAIDGAALSFTLVCPDTIVSATGGKVSKNRFTVDLKLVDLMVLEKPLEFSVTWRLSVSQTGSASSQESSQDTERPPLKAVFLPC